MWAVIVVIAVVVVLLVILAAVSKGVSVHVTSINGQIIYPNGTTSGFLGQNSQVLSATGVTVNEGGPFTETFTLDNSGPMTTSHSIISISASTPGFTVISVSPDLPYVLAPGSGVVLTVTLTAPSKSYNGPLTLVVSVE
jgi:hypothetical protein